MIKLDFICKLGGSAITAKEKLETIDIEAITTISKLLNFARIKGKQYIVVHGAGLVFLTSR